MDLPDDLPVVERDVVRIVLVDALDRVLLFRTRDPTYPELGEWWELPGGGVEPDETYEKTAARELHEETGIVIATRQVGPPMWQRHATFRYRGERRLQHELVVVVRLPVPGPPVDGSLRVGYEDEDYFDYRWWPLPELLASAERFYPGRLPALLPLCLAGQQIEEPLEIWS